MVASWVEVEIGGGVVLELSLPLFVCLFQTIGLSIGVCTMEVGYACVFAP